MSVCAPSISEWTQCVASEDKLYSETKTAILWTLIMHLILKIKRSMDYTTKRAEKERDESKLWARKIAAQWHKTVVLSIKCLSN
jgi:hypothetical protein